MSPVTHLLIGWLTANAADLNRRDRAIVTVAGIIPDLDGAGIIAEILTRNSAKPLTWWSDYHHVLGHNVGFCLAVIVIALLLASQKWKTALLVAVSFHLHLLCDLIGARGPDLHQWPIPYLLPFSSAWQWTWSGQWALNAWPNMLITVVALSVTLWLAWKRGCSPLEMFSSKADGVLVSTLRQRFPHSGMQTLD
jgi:inner membrane protein